MVPLPLTVVGPAEPNRAAGRPVLLDMTTRIRNLVIGLLATALAAGCGSSYGGGGGKTKPSPGTSSSSGNGGGY